MKKLQDLSLTVVVGFVILAAAGVASAGTVNCSSFPGGVIDEPVNADVRANVNCTITGDGFVNGNVIANGTSVLVAFGGVVDGNITQTGAGGVVVQEGRVDGTIKESGGGSVVISDGIVNGNIEESNAGDVLVTNSFINGNIKESGDGVVDIFLSGESVMNGKTEEEGPGGLRITVLDDARYKGDAIEMNAGDLITNGDGTFEGNTKELGGGSCDNNIPGDGGDFFGNACE